MSTGISFADGFESCKHNVESTNSPSAPIGGESVIDSPVVDATPMHKASTKIMPQSVEHTSDFITHDSM